jgi:predicted aspartyl protease
MSKPRIALIALSLMAASGRLEAKPQQCGPLREVASLEMTALGDGSRVSVPLTINGKPVNLVVDTGAGMSSLTGPAATELGLRLRSSEAARLVDKDGAAVRRYYLADRFQLGPLVAKGIPFLQQADIGDAQVGGAIGPDLMARYDVEMDFSGQRLNYFSQDHCPGHIVHWAADAVTQVPIRLTPRSRDYPPPAINPAAAGLGADFAGFLMSFGSPVLGTDIRIKVMLDGHEFTANIDTGLDTSTINSEAAQEYFDVAIENGPSEVPQARGDQPRAVTAGAETVTVTAVRQQHRFHTLTFGGISVTNPLFVLKPAPADAHTVGSARSPDITIGMNVLRKLHLYFAFAERMLYLSAAASPAETQGK